MSDDFGPPRDSLEWHNQLDYMTSVLREASDKAQMEKVALMFVFDTKYSRGAITQALHNVEIEKGWH